MDKETFRFAPKLLSSENHSPLLRPSSSAAVKAFLAANIPGDADVHLPNISKGGKRRGKPSGRKRQRERKRPHTAFEYAQNTVPRPASRQMHTRNRKKRQSRPGSAGRLEIERLLDEVKKYSPAPESEELSPGTLRGGDGTEVWSVGLPSMIQRRSTAPKTPPLSPHFLASISTDEVLPAIAQPLHPCDLSAEIVDVGQIPAQLAFKRYSFDPVDSIRLSLWGTRFGKRGNLHGILRFIPACREIDLSNTDVTDDDIAIIAGTCAGLVAVTLDECQKVTDDGIDCLTDVCGESLEQISLQDVKGVTDVGVAFISTRCPQLRELNISGCGRITDVAMLNLAENNADTLSVLKAARCPFISDKGAQRIGPESSFHEISIANCPRITDVGFGEITQRSKLIRKLDASGLIEVTDDGVRTLLETRVMWGFRQHGGFHRMESINLSGCSQLTDISISWIVAGCPNLRCVALNKCAGLRDYGMRALATLKNLDRLEMGYCNGITDEGLLLLCPFRQDLQARKCAFQLKYLDLAHSKNISDESVQVIVQLSPLLRTLKLDGMPLITDAALRMVAHTCGRSLRTLSVGSNSSVSAAGLGAIGEHCVRVHSICLSGALRVRGDAVRSLQRLRHVYDMNLSGCINLSDVALEHLPNWKLRTLDVSEATELSDASLTSVFKVCFELVQLSASRCSRLTSAPIEYARSSNACPSLETLNVYGCSLISPGALQGLASDRKHLHLEFADDDASQFWGIRPTRYSVQHRHQDAFFEALCLDDRSAATLQRSYRCMRARRELAMRQEALAQLRLRSAIDIQRIYRGHVAKLLRASMHANQLFLATRTQYLWRKYRNRKLRRRAVAYWSQRLKKSVMLTWHRNALQQLNARLSALEQERRERAFKFWKNGTLYKCTIAWSSWAKHSAWKRQRLPRAIAFWKSKASKWVFETWRDFALPQARRRRMLVVIFLNCVPLSHRNTLDARCNAYAAKRNHENLMTKHSFEKLKRAVETRKEYIRIASQFYHSSFVSGFGLEVFHAWKMFLWQSRSRRQKEIVSIQMMKKFKKRVALQKLKWYSVAHKRYVRHLKRALSFLSKQLVVKAFNRWHHGAKDQQKQRALIAKATARFKASSTSRAFAAWKERLSQKKDRRSKVARSLARIMKGTLSRSMRAWRTCVDARQELRSRCMLRAKHALYFQVLDAWKEYVEKSRMHRHAQLRKFLKLNLCAARIQAMFRGVKEREYTEDKRIMAQYMVLKIQTRWRIVLSKRVKERMQRYATLREFVRCEKELDQMALEEEMSKYLLKQHAAALMVQQHFRARTDRDFTYYLRGLRAKRKEMDRLEKMRKQLEQHEKNERERALEQIRTIEAAVDIQRVYRGMVAKKLLKKLWIIHFFWAARQS